MITLLSGIVCILHCVGIYGFNVDIGSAVVYNGPAKSEYFGYSVALHSYQNKYWVVVGAPLSNVTNRYDAAETLPRFGAVYKCEYTGSQQCSFIEIDNTPDRTEYSKLNDIPMTLKLEEKSGQWLGGTVYSTGTNGRALACASRYIYRGLPPDPSGDMHYRWVLGKCYLLRNDLSSPQYTREPCADETKGNNEYGYCQAGFSAEFTPDGSDVVMGMVGANRWKGGFVMTSAGNTLYRALSPKDQIDYGNYMGYSVTSGFFSSKSVAEAVAGAPRGSDLKGKVLIYDIASNYPQISVSSQLPPPKDIPIGTYFGSVLCAVDLDNDQFTDILVGAPYYTHVIDEGRVYIYLNNKQGALNLQDKVLEGDKKPNGRFGSAIAAVGDLNQDGFQDVAIGAPMEGDDGSGAVYIYHGSSKGIETSYRQKILGSKVKSGLKMFGLSISGGVDVDKNKYPDIAVGAYGSENAVILRTSRIVNVDGVITLSKTQISLESNDSLCDLEGAKHLCLNMTIMLVYWDQVENGNGALDIKYKVELDKGKESDALRRMFFWDAANSKRTFILENVYTLQNKRTQYELAPVTVYLLDKAEVADVGSLLTFDLTVTLPTTGCGGLCPVLNDYRPNTFRETVAFLKKCKNKLACVPDLAVDGKIIYSPGDLDEVRIGVVKDFTVELDVTNKVEDSAYYSQIFLKHPADLDYIGTDKPAIECSRGESDNGTSTVTCNVGNPLQGKSSVKFGIKFAPGSIKESFTMEVLAKSQDKDANDKDNKKVFSVPVKFEADVEIRGIAKHRQVVYKGPVRVEDDVKKSLDSIGPEVIQTLTIRNRGPSAVDGSVVTINYPALYQSSKPDSYLLYLLLVELEGASGSCDAKVNPLDIKASNDTSEENTQQQSQSQSRKRRDTENKVLNCRTGSCNTFSCNLGQLKMNDKVDIKLTFRLWDNTLLKELDPPEPVDLVTEAKIKVPSQITQSDLDNDKTTVVTTAKPAQTEAQKKKTPWWVILLSVLGGVLLLGGAAAVLWKLGFFKRKRIKDISGPEVNEMTVQ